MSRRSLVLSAAIVFALNGRAEDADSKLDAIIKKLDERTEVIEKLDKKVEELRKEIDQLRNKGK